MEGTYLTYTAVYIHIHSTFFTEGAQTWHIFTAVYIMPTAVYIHPLFSSIFTTSVLMHSICTAQASNQQKFSLENLQSSFATHKQQTSNT